MAQLAVLTAGLLLNVASQASDEVDRSMPKGFLSKYLPSGFSDSKGPMSEHDKFITPSINRMRQGNGPDVASHPAGLSSTNTANTEEKQAMQKLIDNDFHKPIALSAIGAGLLSLVAMLGVRMWRSLQPATVLASSGGHGPGLPANTASALGDYVMEMKSQDPNIDHSAAVLETTASGILSRLETKLNSSIGGWGIPSSQNSHPLTLCYAGPATSGFSKTTRKKKGAGKKGKASSAAGLTTDNGWVPLVDLESLADGEAKAVGRSVTGKPYLVRRSKASGDVITTSCDCGRCEYPLLKADQRPIDEGGEELVCDMCGAAFDLADGSARESVKDAGNKLFAPLLRSKPQRPLSIFPTRELADGRFFVNITAESFAGPIANALGDDNGPRKDSSNV
jgi:nitrite reductase/ring-hydroxylating ferredoxin subunit